MDYIFYVHVRKNLVPLLTSVVTINCITTSKTGFEIPFFFFILHTPNVSLFWVTNIYYTIRKIFLVNVSF